ncbi:MAG TPA: ferritin-like domain-containing protein [Acidobacteriaceae bacterium]|nr:ferritin-like domain-containing protein [Acidobacteriaceae bacterium]
MANLIEDVIAASPNRRSFLKTLAAATAGVSALSVAGITPAQGQTSTEVEVLKFALNLEYLESEFYTYVVNGRGIETFGIGINGEANGANPASGGITTGGKKVGFNNAFQYLTFADASEIASDERQHVLLLRSALGSQAIARPNLDLNALGFGFGSQYEFVKLARIFEDIGVSAYAGGAGLLTTPSVITTAARILAAEAEHASALRMQVALLNIATTPLDGADVIPQPSGPPGHLFSLNGANGLCATRTPGEVLYLAFGNKENATSGGFFPSGVNGSIITSTSPATAANLAT